MTVFDRETQDTHAGGSGCGCAAVTLAAYVLPKIEAENGAGCFSYRQGRLCRRSALMRAPVCRASPTGSCWNIFETEGRGQRWNILPHLLREG